MYLNIVGLNDLFYVCVWGVEGVGMRREEKVVQKVNVKILSCIYIFGVLQVEVF